jgi:hypothetical protein
VRVLLRLGADAACAGDNGQTALDAARVALDESGRYGLLTEPGARARADALRHIILHLMNASSNRTVQAWEPPPASTR